MTSASVEPSWKDTLAPYAQARTSSAVLQVFTSLLPYLLLSAASYLTLGISPLLTIALAIPTGGFLIRTFVVFHDCSHGSLFPSRVANRRVGVVLGLFVLAPFRRWQHDHAVHHATSGDLDRRGVGDLPTLTVSEYDAKPWRGRLGYRLFRNPVVMFGVGPIFAMIIGPRIFNWSARPRLRNSVIATDVVLAAAVALICWAIGWAQFLVVWTPPALLAGSAGIWLFYVQHQFEDTYWQSGDDWQYAEAALRGSSFLRLPKVLQFFTASIGLHHVHHLNAKVPNYNLQRAHDAHPLFADVPTISMWDGIMATRFKLWDERHGKLVTFAEARRSTAGVVRGAEDHAAAHPHGVAPIGVATQEAAIQ
jgi:acyl-lipid omega-6 desaturase (Delta-12 desaturase)